MDRFLVPGARRIGQERRHVSPFAQELRPDVVALRVPLRLDGVQTGTRLAAGLPLGLDLREVAVSEEEARLAVREVRIRVPDAMMSRPRALRSRAPVAPRDPPHGGTWMRRAGVADDSRAEVLGHRNASVRMTLDYTHADPVHVAPALDALEAFDAAALHGTPFGAEIGAEVEDAPVGASLGSD